MFLAVLVFPFLLEAKPPLGIAMVRDGLKKQTMVSMQIYMFASMEEGDRRYESMKVKKTMEV